MTRSDGFSVDPNALSHARDGVARLLRDMGEFTTPGPSTPASAFGHDELAEATAEFQETWSDGVRDLSADTASFHEQLNETINVYRRVDDDAAVAFDRLRDE